MPLEIYQIIILILIGSLVGISLSFIGQTGQVIVLPTVLLITGDVFLAIAINLLNDLITSAFVSIKYVKSKQYKIRKDIIIIIVIGILTSILSVFILMTTLLGNIYGWFIPLFIIFLGLLFIKRGFPTADTINNTIQKITSKILKKSVNEDRITELGKKIDDRSIAEGDKVQGLIPSSSRLYYLLTIFFGIFIGVNSGLFGANSGLLFVLALVILYGYPLKKGVGTALILSAILCFSTFIIYQILGFTIKGQFYFNLEISVFLAIGSIITGVITSIYVQKLSAKIMGQGIGILIIVLGILSLIFYFIT